MNTKEAALGVIDFKQVLNGVVKNEARRQKKAGYSPEDVVHAGKLLEDYHVEDVIIQGNFTVVTIGNHRGSMYTGVSKRHPKDKHNPLRAVMLATSRAIQDGIIMLSLKSSIDKTDV